MSVNGSGETESHPYLNRLHILYIMAFQHLIDIGLFHVIDETDIFEYHLGVDNLILLRIVDQILCVSLVIPSSRQTSNCLAPTLKTFFPATVASSMGNVRSSPYFNRISYKTSSPNRSSLMT